MIPVERVDVIIPTIRPDAVQKALYSLSKNTIKPDLVTIVSNEVQDKIPCHGLNVRLVRFSSSYYPYGVQDVALRRNIGIWSSPCSHIITFDDDQIAPKNMIEQSIELFKRRLYFWGHHRFISFSMYSVDEILQMPPEKGRSRERPANAWHSWQSCYAGLFGTKKALVQEVGGFDMAFCGRHAGEDQNLGRRMAREIDNIDRVFIYEPPFAWHPEEKIPWTAVSSNLCSSQHQISSFSHEGLIMKKCSLCPYQLVVSGDINRDRSIIKFDSNRVEISSIKVNA